jgi:hypothetical protein
LIVRNVGWRTAAGWPIVACVVIAAAGIGLVLFATRHGVGVTPDSVYYISGARNIAAGLGYSMPLGGGDLAAITQWPPLFPASLAALTFLGLDPVEGARWLNAVLLALDSALIAWIVYRETRALAAGVISALVFMASPWVLQSYSQAWSEPIMITLALAFFLLLGRYLDSGRFGVLIVAAAICSVAYLARYAAGFLMLAGLVAVFSQHAGAARRRLWHAAVFGMICLTVPLLWTVRNSLAHSAVGRDLGWHPISAGFLPPAIRTIGSWFAIPDVPLPFSILILATAGVLLAYLLLPLMREATLGDPVRSRLNLPFLFVSAYLVTIAVSVSFVDAEVTADNRLMLPAYVFLIIGVSIMLARLAGLKTWRRGRVILGLALIVLAVGNLGLRSSDWLTQAGGYGGFYTSPEWQSSATIRYVRALPPGVRIFSNAPDAVLYLTGRPAYQLPEFYNGHSARYNQEYDKEMTAMAQVVESGGMVIYFDLGKWRRLMPSESEVTRLLPLQLSRKTADGSVYVRSASRNP